METEQTAVPRRFAEHLLSEAGLPSRCELTAYPGETDEGDEGTDLLGRCPGQAVAMRWEDGFADAVCARHRVDAQERGAVVVRPARHNGD